MSRIDKITKTMVVSTRWENEFEPRGNQNTKGQLGTVLDYLEFLLLAL